MDRGIDWPTWIVAVAAGVQAGAAVAIWLLTRSLAQDTKLMAEEMRLSREALAREPSVRAAMALQEHCHRMLDHVRDSAWDEPTFRRELRAWGVTTSTVGMALSDPLLQHAAHSTIAMFHRSTALTRIEPWQRARLQCALEGLMAGLAGRIGDQDWGEAISEAIPRISAAGDWVEAPPDARFQDYR